MPPERKAARITTLVILIQAIIGLKGSKVRTQTWICYPPTQRLSPELPLWKVFLETQTPGSPPLFLSAGHSLPYVLWPTRWLCLSGPPGPRTQPERPPGIQPRLRKDKELRIPSARTRIPLVLISQWAAPRNGLSTPGILSIQPVCL